MFRSLFTIVLILAACWRLPADDAPTVEAERASFRLADASLEIKIVASEPAVTSPVAIAWDEFGRLYVVEMTDYPADGSGGQVKRLEDRDGDGVYEHATLFAEKLAWPSGVAPFDGGILVTSAPNLLYFKDTNDDGRADIKKIVLTGFGEGNQQLRVNSPTWGLDNYFYLANGRSGGAVRKPEETPDKAVNIARNDIRFNPRTGELQAIAGFSQFGLPRDNWGNRFPSWNTVPVRHVVFDQRNATGGILAGQVADILNLNDGGRLYSLAPSQKRFNAESVAFFNATCGPVINRDARLGANYQGDAFVCEPLSSLVHRRKLVADGPSFTAERAEQGREFLASAHPWFRPVNLANGPDGALYVVDFCRAWVEHPAFVPEKQRNLVDFREGFQRGRVWRVSSQNDNGKELNKKWPDKMKSTELAALLEAPNAWQRDTAQRLLVERQDQSAVESLIQICRSSTSPTAVAQALWTLHGLKSLNSDIVKTALKSPDEHVRAQAVRLIDLTWPEAAEWLSGLARDPSVIVRLQVVLALAEHKNKNALKPLVEIAERDAGSPWVLQALMSTVGNQPLQFIGVIAQSQPDWLANPAENQSKLLLKLAEAVGREQKQAEMMKLLPRFSNSNAKMAIVVGLLRTGDEIKRQLLEKLSEDESSSQKLISEATGILKNEAVTPWAATLAFELTAELKPGAARTIFMDQLTKSPSLELQKSLIQFLPKLRTPELIEKIVAGWDSIPIGFRRRLVAAMVSSPDLAKPLLGAIQVDKIGPGEIDPAARSILQKTGGAEFQKLVAETLKLSPLSDRSEVLKRYTSALTLKSVPARGRLHFEKNCVACHTLQGRGAKVGPELAGVAGKSPEELMTSILDPARDATPDGIGVLVLTRDGRTLSGLLVAEDASVVRLRRAEGIEETISRADVEQVRSTGRSLMPEGFEQVLSPQDLADVISFLRNPSTAP